ncbi:hypothetical protein [Streptomyces mangrovisoli]|uniref:IrrE N-terminal-like domain-containing protein n=1 Tax=Streptomyces mangrovisoli TaxID=1428628 RepID=A0A1J4NMB8_9ACTN|nr:hypothetical protein [Streptomyces mangrovisoli]OIJ62764.1 hypothetical protein WN71_037790 [Streptomyces mangrovisoli]
MSQRKPKAFIDRLLRSTAPTLPRASNPRDVLQAVCTTLSPQLDRPIRLKFVEFPVGMDVSGITLAKDDEYIVVVERNAPPKHQFVIAGHEYGHCYYRTLNVHYPGSLPTAARRLLDQADDDIPWDEVIAMATRSADALDPAAEWEAEQVGLHLASKFPKLVGPQAGRDPLAQQTLSDRLSSSLGPLGGL